MAIFSHGGSDRKILTAVGGAWRSVQFHVSASGYNILYALILQPLQKEFCEGKKRLKSKILAFQRLFSNIKQLYFFVPF